MKSAESNKERQPAGFDRAPYRRARILNRLSSATDYPVTILVAAAGYGKTTAVTEFLEHCPDHVLFTTPHAPSIQTFVTEFSRACARRFPLMGTPPDGIDSSSENISESIELCMHWALTHLREAKCIIAIDDLHLGDIDPAIGMFVTRLVDGTKSSINWILSSRTHGKLPISRWRAYGDADDPILSDELRITLDEAKTLAENWKSPATAAQLEQWLRQTNGFPVSLSYAIRLSARRGTVEGIFDGTRALTFDFLADHLWSTLGEPDREILEVAAFLPQIHMHHFEAAGLQLASTRLTDLSADIAFLRLDSGNNFVMHDLFRDFVVQRVSISGPALLLKRRLTAIQILTKANRFNEALRIVLSCGDSNALVAYFEEVGERIDDHSLIREVVIACQTVPMEHLGLKLLTTHADYWAWHGDARKSLLFSSQVLINPKADGNHLFRALRSAYRSIDVQSESEQKAWLADAAKYFDFLSASNKIQLNSFKASILARYEQSRIRAEQLINANEPNFYLLSVSDRLSAEIAAANASFWLGNMESTLRFSRAAVHTATALGDLREQARTLNNLGIFLNIGYDPEVATLFEPLRAAVESTGSWRFSHVSHWLPSFYFALKGDQLAFNQNIKLQSFVHPLEDPQRKLLRSFRRTSENLGNILAEQYTNVIRDFSRVAPDPEIRVSYALFIENAVAHFMMRNQVSAKTALNRARELRGKLTDYYVVGIQESVLMEVICLAGTGQWAAARKLCEDGITAAPALAPAKEMLRRFCDGPPFLGVREAQRKCVGQPFIGLAALLVERTIDRFCFDQLTPNLTSAETDVLKLLSLGKSNKAIADARSRSTETVKRQVAAIYKKLGVENRTSALATAKELGLV